MFSKKRYYAITYNFRNSIYCALYLSGNSKHQKKGSVEQKTVTTI